MILSHLIKMKLHTDLSPNPLHNTTRMAKNQIKENQKIKKNTKTSQSSGSLRNLNLFVEVFESGQPSLVSSTGTRAMDF